MDDEDLGQVEGGRELPPLDRDPACGGWPAVGEDGRPDLRRQGGDRGDEEPDTRRSQPDHEPSRGRPADGRGHRVHVVVACSRESLARTGGATSPSWRPATRRSTSSSPTSCSRSSCSQTSCCPTSCSRSSCRPTSCCRTRCCSTSSSPTSCCRPSRCPTSCSRPSVAGPGAAVPEAASPAVRPALELRHLGRVERLAEDVLLAAEHDAVAGQVILAACDLERAGTRRLEVVLFAVPGRLVGQHRAEVDLAASLARAGSGPAGRRHSA